MSLLLSCSDNTRTVVFSENAPLPIGPYRQAILANGTLYVSGQLGLKKDGSLDSTNIENECNQALVNIRSIVEEAGMKMSDVSKATIYLTDLKNFSRVNKIYETFFPKDPPARETVEVRALPKGAHVEISVIVK
jgi:2-iminobutanoate/2-iminopropanoate deaminase